MSAKYDFRLKRYGYGWTPITARGWLVTFGFIILAVSYVSLVVGPHDEFIGASQLIELIVGLSVIVSLFTYVTNLTAPKARWQWGKKNDKSE